MNSLTTLVKDFSPTSSWKPPVSHSNLYVFLSQVENELFEITKELTRYSNLSQEKWQLKEP